MRRWVIDSVLVLLGALFACGPSGDAPAGASHSVADSAGIEMVISSDPAWSDGEGWAVDATPSVRIGEVDGSVETSFGNVRDAGRLADGRIYVGDEQAHAIRVFSPEGEYLQSVGREGQGPGELQSFLTADPYRGDSLWVYDYARSVVSVFGPEPTFARRFRNPMPIGNFWIVAGLSDGRFILYSPGPNRRDLGPGVHPDTSVVVVTGPEGESIDTIGSFRVRTLAFDADGESSTHLFPGGNVVARGQRAVVLEGVRFEYREIGPDGGLERIVRRAWHPLPVTPEIIDDYYAHRLDLVGRNDEGRRERALQSLDESVFAEQLPATGYEVIVDELDHVWVSNYHFPGSRAEEWSVFDPGGVWLGEVRTPPGLEVMWIGEEDVIGSYLDELDVPFVHVHSLDREASRGARDERGRQP